MKAIHLDVPDDGLAPYYRRFGDSYNSRPVFLQLDPSNGRVSYGWCRDDGISTREKEGRLFRWPVHPMLRGDHSVVVARVVQPLLQSIQDGYSEKFEKVENSNYQYVGRLNASAWEAKFMVLPLLDRPLIDENNPLHVARVFTPDEFIREWIAPKSSVGPDTTNMGLALLCRESLEAANDDGAFVDGVLIDALTAMRDEMRETGMSR